MNSKEIVDQATNCIELRIGGPEESVQIHSQDLRSDVSEGSVQIH